MFIEQSSSEWMMFTMRVLLRNNSALIPRMLVIWILTIVDMIVVVEGMGGCGGWRKTCISSVTENVEKVSVATNEF